MRVGNAERRPIERVDQREPVVLTGHGGDHWFWNQALFLPQELLTLRLPTFLRDAADLVLRLNKPRGDEVAQLQRGGNSAPVLNWPQRLRTMSWLIWI